MRVSTIISEAAKRSAARSRFLATLQGEAVWPPPIWLMRQAGRYLPEYRDIRAQAGSFLDLCFDPVRASRVTLQPIERFDFDAAILFADILLIPHALGQGVRFEEGEGPRLFPTITTENIRSLEIQNIGAALAPIFETVRLTRAALGPEKTLIGFAGAPWTVATYMLAGGASRDPAGLRRVAYEQPAFLEELIALLVKATVAYLVGQIDAGAEAVQLFDTWAGGLPEPLARRLSLDPMRSIARRVKALRPGTPFIFFPRGVGALASAYAEAPECDAISIDSWTPWEFARASLSSHAVVQGGFDPMLVVAGGEAMDREARALVNAFRGVPYIFNLGHGLTPDTPPAHVARLVKIVREME